MHELEKLFALRAQHEAERKGTKIDIAFTKDYPAEQLRANPSMTYEVMFQRHYEGKSWKEIGTSLGLNEFDVDQVYQEGWRKGGRPMLRNTPEWHYNHERFSSAWPPPEWPK